MFVCHAARKEISNSRALIGECPHHHRSTPRGIKFVAEEPNHSSAARWFSQSSFTFDIFQQTAVATHDCTRCGLPENVLVAGSSCVQHPQKMTAPPKSRDPPGIRSPAAANRPVMIRVERQQAARPSLFAWLVVSDCIMNPQSLSLGVNFGVLAQTDPVTIRHIGGITSDLEMP